MSTLEYAYDVLFEPIGISNALWMTDNQEINFGGTMLYLYPRNMARLGYLYLNNGTWDGEQLLPKDWVINSTTPFIGSSLNNVDYGYLWWLDDDYYYAWGSEGQKIFVIPDYDMVVVFTGSSNTQEPYEFILENYILPACLNYTSKFIVNYFTIISISLIVLLISKKNRKK